MKTNLLTLAITLTIGVILAGSLLMPVISDAQKNTNDTLINEVSEGMTFKLDGVDDYNLTTTDSVRAWLINGTAVDMYSAAGALAITDKCRFEKNGGYVSLYDATGSRIANLSGVANKVVVEYTAETKVFSVTTYTGAGDSAELANTYTYNVENILYYIPGGDYGAIQTNGDPDISYYVNDLSEVIAGGAYTTGDLDTSYFAEGTTVYVGNSSYTASGTATTVKEYTDAIKGSSYSITVTDGEDSETFTPYTVFVPLKVIAHTSEQNGQIALYGAIPILVIVGLLMAAIGAIYTKRDD